MKTSLCIVTAQVFTNGEPDKNGLAPVILVPIAGKCPIKRVLAGTVAQNSNFELNNTYLVKWVESGNDPEYGAEYSFTNVGNLSDNIMGILEASEKLGPAVDITE